MSDEKSLGTPEWDELGVPEAQAEPEDAGVPHTAPHEEIERLVEGD